MVCLGVYKHPFKDRDLLGPYLYTDGEYYWDRDTWKYVVKYHVTLPQAFIDKVMSEEGTVFLNSQAVPRDYWKKMMDRPRTINMLPEDVGDIGLEEF